MVEVVVRRVISGARYKTQTEWNDIVVAAGKVYDKYPGVHYASSTVTEGSEPYEDEVHCSFSGPSFCAIKAAVDETGIPYTSIMPVVTRLSRDKAKML